MTHSLRETPPDHAKILAEWALTAGRSLQSKQTGYVHLYEGETDEEARTIPVLENTLFALALLRSRSVEAVQEAKGILKGLLPFQHEQQERDRGNFPVYLHEYPVCKDAYVGLRLLAPFYWMLKLFGHVLGGELKEGLQRAVRLALENSLLGYQEHPFPYPMAVRLAAARFAYAILWNEESGEHEENLRQLATLQLEGWYTTAQLGDLLVGLQMAYPSLREGAWQPLWECMETSWHHPTASYMGPCFREWHRGPEPQPNLYDLYGGYFAGMFSKRASLSHFIHLHGVLIQASSDRFRKGLSGMVAGRMKGRSWQLHHSEEGAYTLIAKEFSPPSTGEHLLTPFRWIWGDENRVHSLVCQGGRIDKVEYMVENSLLRLFLDLGETPVDEGSEPQREVEFFVDCCSDMAFYVNGLRTTTFKMDEEVMLSFGSRRCRMTFSMLEGEGTFVGHLMWGNRPSQTLRKGEQRFQSYDWTLFLRTVRRSGPCRLEVKIGIDACQNDEDRFSSCQEFSVVSSSQQGLSTDTPMACKPLSTYKIVPVIAEASSEERKAETFPTSEASRGL